MPGMTAVKPRKIVPVSVEERARKLVAEARPEAERAVKRGVLRVEDGAVKLKITAALRKLHPMD